MSQTTCTFKESSYAPGIGVILDMGEYIPINVSYFLLSVGVYTAYGHTVFMWIWTADNVYMLM